MYKTVQGFVYTDIWPQEANGKKIRTCMVSYPDLQIVDGEVVTVDRTVKVTVWDSHGATPLAKGDYIICNGKYEIQEYQDKAGETVHQHTVSANKFINVGNGLDAPGKTQPVNEAVKKERPPIDQIPGL